MGQSFEDLYQEFCDVMNAEYRTEPERQTALIEALADTMKAMLEKLRDLDT